MSKGVTNSKLRQLFPIRNNMSIGFYVTDFIFRRIFRQNASVKWAIHHTVTIHCPEKIIRGKDVYPGDSPGVYINAQNGLEVGDYTNIGPNVGIITANHDFFDNNVHQPEDPIKLGRFCWLGMGAVILPGVILGDFTIVGAGTIVTKSFPEGFCILAGNPARVIRELNKETCDTFASSKE